MARTITIPTASGQATFILHDERLPGGNIPANIADTYFRSDAGPSGINTAGIDPAAVDDFRNFVQAGFLEPVDENARNFILSQGGLRAGDPTPLGPLIGGLPGGLDATYWQVVIQKANNEAQQKLAQAAAQGYFGPNPPKIDPATGMFDLSDPTLTAAQRNTLISAQQQAARDAVTARLADNTIRQTDLDEAYRRATLAENTRQFDVAQTGYDNGTPTLAREAQALSRENQAFTQYLAAAQQASNPRNYLTAAMLPGTRGGLGGQPASNVVTPTTTAGTTTAGFTAPVTYGQPGAPDHVATIDAGGTQLHVFSSPTTTAAVPIGAGTASLIAGAPVPASGALNVSGGFVAPTALQQVANPANWNPTSYANLRPSEQAQANAVASFGGFSDEDTAAALQANLPKFKAPVTAGISG